MPLTRLEPRSRANLVLTAYKFAAETLFMGQPLDVAEETRAPNAKKSRFMGLRRGRLIPGLALQKAHAHPPTSARTIMVRQLHVCV